MEKLKEVKETIIENELELEKITTYYPNGQIVEECYYKDGELHREGDKPAAIWYNLKGTVACESYFQNGKHHRDGGKAATTHYSYNGDVIARFYFKNGVPIE